MAVRGDHKKERDNEVKFVGKDEELRNDSKYIKKTELQPKKDIYSFDDIKKLD